MSGADGLPWRPAPSLIRRRPERPAGPLAGYPVAAVGSSWGGAGPGLSGARRQPQVGEDGAHDSWVLDGGDDPRPAAASGTGHDIESEHAGINAAQVQACGRPGGRGRTNPPVGRKTLDPAPWGRV